MGTTPTTPSLSKSNGCVASATGECIAKTDRLIAAAPALLEALQAIQARIDGEWDHPALDAFGPLSADTFQDVKDLARAAIAQAKGEQHG